MAWNAQVAHLVGVTGRDPRSSRTYMAAPPSDGALGCSEFVADLDRRAKAWSRASGAALGGEPRVHPFDPALARRMLKAPARGARGGPKDPQDSRAEQDG